jgi:co-chaperonin GroES (HSP10)
VVNGIVSSASTSFTLTVNAVNDAPTLNAIADPAAIDEDATQQTVNLAGVTAGPLETQVLAVTATSSNTALIANPAVSYTSPNATGSLSYAPAANTFGTASITVTVTDDQGGTVSRTFAVTVNPVADTPSISGAATNEDTQTASGLVVARNAADGVEVTHFKVTSVTGGTLFQHDGTTPIATGAFITAAQGSAGLRFTPAANAFATGHVSVQASIGANDSGLGGAIATADIIVTPIADAPVVTPATTAEDTQTASGLVLSRSAADGAEVTHFKISAVTNGSLFQHDGTTPIASGDVITFAQGDAGLRFTPAPNVFGTASFVVQGATSASGAGTGAATTASITVAPVADTPAITNASTIVNTQTESGLVVGRNAVDGSEVTHVKVTAVSGGTLFHNDGVTAIPAGTFVTMAQGAAGLKFTPATNSVATGHVSIQASLAANDAGLGGGIATADIVVVCPTLTIGPATIAPAVLGTPYSQTFTVSGGGPGTVVFALTGTIPPGLTFDAATATLSGITTAPGSYPITVTATPNNGCGAASANYTLAVGGGRTVLTGADAGGGPHVRRFTALDGSEPRTGASSFYAFDPTFGGGVRVAEGDVNADGKPDYIVGAGPGGAPDVLVLDGGTGAVAWAFTAFEPEFRGGVYVAAGDVNGDGFVDVIAAAGGGRSGEVKVFSGRDGSVLLDQRVFDPSFTGGVRVAAGDVNGDGLADLILGTGPGAASVTILNGAGGGVLDTFTAYPAFGGGVFVAAADVTGDGYADVITGAGEGGSPQVRVFDVHAGTAPLAFNAFEAGFTGGVRVAAGDVNGDGHADVVAGSGPGRIAATRLFDGVTAAPISEVQPYGAGFTAGLFVGTSVPYAQMLIDAPVPGTMRGTFTLAGWAFEEGAGGSGIGGIDVSAIPVGSGSPVSLGTATLGDARPDVAAIYGAAYGHAGFHLAVTALAPGTYDLRVTARRAGTGLANLVRSVRVTIRPEPVPLVHIDVPAPARLDSGTFHVSGWAFTPENATPPGVDAVHVYAALVPSGTPQFVGAATLGLARPDVAATYGPEALNSGFDLAVTGLGAGTWDLYVYPRETGKASFAAPAIVRVTVPGAFQRVIATGADAGGGPHVRRFAALDGGAPASGVLSSFFAYDASFTGGVRVAEGDLTGDGVAETVSGAGPGGTPVVRVFDGATGAARASFLAFEPGFTGGVYVAAGDVNGDGVADIVVGSGAGRVGELKVFDGRALTLLSDTTPFGAAFTGGVRVAAGDVTGDGLADLVVGSGPGITAEVRVFNAATGAQMRAFHPYGAFTGGVFVAAGDVSGDGYADLVTGADAGGGPHVQVFDGVSGALRLGFFAFDPSFSGGVRVAVGDVGSDGRADVIVGSGPGRPAAVRVFDGSSGTQVNEVLPYGSGYTAGLFVATAVPINRLSIDTLVPGSTVSGPVWVAGWGFIENASNAGIAAMHVWAVPVGSGAPVFLGLATLGEARPDVAAQFGAQYGHAGYEVTGPSLAAGVYDIAVFGQSALTGNFAVVRIVRVTIAP